MRLVGFRCCAARARGTAVLLPSSSSFSSASPFDGLSDEALSAKRCEALREHRGDVVKAKLQREGGNTL